MSNDDDVEQPDAVDDEQAQSDRYRTIGIVAVLAVLALGGAVVLFDGIGSGGVVTAAMIQAERMKADTTAKPSNGIPLSATVLSRLKFRDTIYTTDSLYLEVNLTHQNVTVHRRNGSSRTFLISSGTPALREGMATPTGVFTVQGMTPMAISKQFNDAKLHHWIGVQGGVGFHGLDGSGYYGNLGKRPSSHGCIRMSREEVGEMYSMVHPGALIMVHYGDPARVVAFCNRTDTAGATLIDSANVFNRNLGRDRLKSFYSGTALTDPRPRLVHLAGQRLRWGMEIGKGDHIIKQQIPEGISFSSTQRVHPSLPSDRMSVAALSDQWGIASIKADSLDKHRRAAAKAEDEREPQYGE